MNKLDIYTTQDYILNDAFDQAVVNIHIQKEQNGYKTYTVCGCEPGDGSTTVAINLAAALANSGWKTVLVDGDMRKKKGYKRLNEGASVGLSEYLTAQAQINDIIYCRSIISFFIEQLPCRSYNSSFYTLLVFCFYRHFCSPCPPSS